MTVIHLQATIWSVCANVDDDDVIEGTLPSLPNLHYVVGMLVHMEHVHRGVLNLIRLACHLGDEPGDLSSGLEKLTLSNSQVALCCNELAASLLTVIKSTLCTTSKELSKEVQSLSHEIARAGKNLNQLLKKRRSSKSRKSSGSRIQPQIPQSSEDGKSVIAVNSVERERNGTESGKKRGEDELKEKERAVKSSERLKEEKRRTMKDASLGPNPRKTVASERDDSALKHCKTWSSIEESLEDTSDLLKSSSDGKIGVTEERDLSNSVKLSKSCEPLNVTGLKYSETSNATGQVISESPSNSPPHQPHPQNGFSGAADDEDSSVI